MIESNLYYAVAQRTQNGRYMNLWLNGSDKKDMIDPQILYSALEEKGMYEMVNGIKAAVMGTFSFYLLDFINGQIGLLSALKTTEGVSIAALLNSTKNVIDEEANQRNINGILNIGFTPGENKKTKNEKAIELKFWGRETKSNTSDHVFQSFLKNLTNWTK